MFESTFYRRFRRGRGRSGFTAVELLVVIAIIAILIALLLPAIQTARRKARQIQCLNNAKQIGTATSSYFSDHTYFPQNGRHTTKQGESTYDQYGYPKQENWGFLWRILPHMEQEVVFRAENLVARQQPISQYLCPVWGPRVMTGPDGNTVAITDWAGNAGLIPLDYEDEWCVGPLPPEAHADGIIVRDSEAAVTESAVVDGLSNTFLGGEAMARFEARQAGLPHWGRKWGFVGPWIPCDRVQEEFPATIGASDTIRSGLGGVKWSYPGADPRSRSFGSGHPNGAIMIRADGSAQNFGYDTDLIVFRALCTRAGQELTGN